MLIDFDIFVDPPSNDDPMEDFTVSDNVVAFTQLREEIETLKKKLSVKDQEILDRDKKVCTFRICQLPGKIVSLSTVHADC